MECNLRAVTILGTPRPHRIASGCQSRPLVVDRCRFRRRRNAILDSSGGPQMSEALRPIVFLVTRPRSRRISCAPVRGWIYTIGPGRVLCGVVKAVSVGIAVPRPTVLLAQ